MLKHILSLIESGKPLWALLTANEYYTAQHPLGRAIRSKVCSALLQSPAHEIPGHLIARLLEGVCLGDLSPEEQRLFRGRREERNEGVQEAVRTLQLCPAPTLRIGASRRRTQRLPPQRRAKVLRLNATMR